MMNGRWIKNVLWLLFVIATALFLCACTQKLSSGKRIVYGVITQVKQVGANLVLDIQIATDQSIALVHYTEYRHEDLAEGMSYSMNLTDNHLSICANEDCATDEWDQWMRSKTILEFRIDRDEVQSISPVNGKEIDPSFNQYELPYVGELNPYLEENEKLVLFGDSARNGSLFFYNSNSEVVWLDYFSSEGTETSALYVSVESPDTPDNYAYVMQMGENPEEKQLLLQTQNYYNVFWTNEDGYYSLFYGDLQWNDNNTFFITVDMENEETSELNLNVSLRKSAMDSTAISLSGSISTVDEISEDFYWSNSSHEGNLMYDDAKNYAHHTRAFWAEGITSYERFYAFDDESNTFFEVEPGKLFLNPDRSYTFYDADGNEIAPQYILYDETCSEGPILFYTDPHADASNMQYGQMQWTDVHVLAPQENERRMIISTPFAMHFE